MSICVSVLFPLTLPHLYTYEAPDGMVPQTGQFVQALFGKRQLLGVVWETPATPPPDITLKPLLEVLPFFLPDITRLFMERVATYTLAPLGSLLKMVLGGVSDSLLTPTPLAIAHQQPYCSTPVHFSVDQQEALQSLQAFSLTGGFKPVVLEGLTGSGKTEVYFEEIARLLEKQKQQVLVLLPEIALTSQLIRRFEQRFGFTPHLWHADITLKNRKQTWQAVLKGEARVVIGARSALFLPYPDLGLIVVDEEHDNSYKQEEGQVRYHARDMAVLRASCDKIPIILVSATPSLETRWNINQGRYQHVQLNTRFQASLPTLSLIPFIKEPSSSHFISPLLREKLIQTFNQQEQSLLFLNRRGYAPFVSCKKCGTIFNCPDCHIGFVFHQRINGLLCHYCGKTQNYQTPCVQCDTQDYIALKGPGVEKIAEEVTSFLPQARFQVMSSDHITSPRKLEKLMRALEAREIDLLIGTQMVAKGHHFPHLTCVSILDGDAGVNSLDFRGPERLLQLLTQVAGRAGRGQAPGYVYVQTRNPEDPLLQTFLQHNQNQWWAQEMERRRQQGWPPETRLAALIITSPSLEKGQLYTQRLARLCPSHPQIRVLGPIPAPLFKIRHSYRWRFLVQSPRNLPLQNFLKQWTQTCPPTPPVRLIPDIDPYQFL